MGAFIPTAPLESSRLTPSCLTATGAAVVLRLLLKTQDAKIAARAAAPHAQLDERHCSGWFATRLTAHVPASNTRASSSWRPCHDAKRWLAHVAQSINRSPRHHRRPEASSVDRSARALGCAAISLAGGSSAGFCASQRMRERDMGPSVPSIDRRTRSLAAAVWTALFVRPSTPTWFAPRQVGLSCPQEPATRASGDRHPVRCVDRMAGANSSGSVRRSEQEAYGHSNDAAPRTNITLP